MKKLLYVTAILLGFSSSAWAISQSFSVVVPSTPSTAITCPAPAAGFTLSGTTFTYSGSPLPAGTALCTLSVTPSGWAGVLTLSGTNGASFAISGLTLSVGSTALTTGTYAVTVTATP